MEKQSARGYNADIRKHYGLKRNVMKKRKGCAVCGCNEKKDGKSRYRK